MDNLEKYNKVFESIFNIDSKELDEEFAYGNIKIWDSVTHLSLVNALEEEFDILFDSSDILEFHSYEKGKLIMAKYDVNI